eukprot:g9575.t1 g9575   contig4:47945-51550(-)
MPPKSGQKSLISFFGNGKSSKTEKDIPKKKVQGALKKAFAREEEDQRDNNDDETNVIEKADCKALVKDENSNGGTGKTKHNNNDNGGEGNDLMDTDDDGGNSKPAAAAAKKLAKKEGGSKGGGSSGSKKRIIDDSDSEEDNDVAEKKATTTNSGEKEKQAASKMMDTDKEEEEEYKQEPEDESGGSTASVHSEEEISEMKQAAAAGKKSSNDDDDEFFAPKSKKQKTNTTTTKKTLSSKSATGTKSASTAANMKSNAQLSSLLTSKINSDPDGWKADKPTPYSALCDTFSEIEAISSRLEIQERMTELFRMVLIRDGGGDGDWKETSGKKKSDDKEKSNGKDTDALRSDLYPLLYLASNSVAPSYECVELGVGDSILVKAIGEASGTNPQMIKKKYEKEGDLGTVAQTSKGKQKTLIGFGKLSGPKRLDVREVLKVFREIATTSGSQSQKWKVDKIKGLLVRAKGSEAKYIIRGLQGKLRIGLAQSSVLASLSHAIVLTKPKDVVPLTEERLKEIRSIDADEKGAYPDFARKLCAENLPLDVKLETSVAIVKKAYSEVPSFDSLLDALLSAPLQEMHKACNLTPGIPVEPMLAKPTKSVLEVLKRLNGARFTCEYKYDGERAQVHMTPDGKTKVFSRSLLNTSEKFPEVPLYVQEACKETSVTSFVLDTEVVAFNRVTQQFVPFQVLSTRKKTEESAEDAKVKVIVQAFDLMYLNGESLLDRPLAERRELMRKNFIPVPGKFQFATSLDHTEDGDTAVVEEFLDNAVKGQCEGLMVKTLDVNAAYEPSRRSLNWLKLKKDYLEGLGDSVDLVPLGAYHGRGKRTGVYGAYLLAVYEEDTEEFQSVCKIGTGFSEEDLKELAASLKPHIIPEKSSQYVVSDSLECDVWFDAVQVWEVKAADLSKSSTHKGAVDKTGESGRGIGLRFPRFERVRPDKKPEDATSADQILDMYYNQDSIVNTGDGGIDDDGI